MPRFLRWLSLAFLGVFGLLIVLAAVVLIVSQRKLHREYDITVRELTISPLEGDTALGRVQAEVRGCAFCHGEELGGAVFADEPAFGRYVAPNLTAGPGGVAARYSDEDWARAVRHGVNPAGLSLLIMPARDFAGMSDRDLANLVAYIRSAPPVEGKASLRKVGPVARILLAFGQVDLEAEAIDHDAVHPAPEPGVTVDYGEYLSQLCQSCHGADLTGLPLGGMGPPPGPNLTPGGALSDWSQEDFVTTLRTGIRPDDRPLAEEMPWPWLGQLSDDELSALWLYLQSLPPSSGPAAE